MVSFLTLSHFLFFGVPLCAKRCGEWLETFLCLLLVRDDFSIRWGRFLAWIVEGGKEMHLLAFRIDLIPGERWRLEV